MDKIHKRVLFFITVSLEIILYMSWKLYGDKWTWWDNAFCIFVICCHAPFYVALFFENRPWLDFLHMTVFLSTLFGFFMSSIHLLMLVLVFILGLQCQWTCINKCILNTPEQNEKSNLGYGKITSIATLFYSCYLAYKIGVSTYIDKKRKKRKIKSKKKKNVKKCRSIFHIS